MRTIILVISTLTCLGAPAFAAHARPHHARAAMQQTLPNQASDFMAFSPVTEDRLQGSGYAVSTLIGPRH